MCDWLRLVDWITDGRLTDSCAGNESFAHPVHLTLYE